jgi:hypothetical protein
VTVIIIDHDIPARLQKTAMVYIMALCSSQGSFSPQGEGTKSEKARTFCGLIEELTCQRRR